MAEIIGLASGMVSLVTIAAQITKISYNLISDFRNAPHSQELFLLELLSLKDVVLQAQETCEAATTAGFSIKYPDVLNHRTFAACLERLSSIQQEVQAGIGRVKWLLKEKEFKQHGEALRYFRDIFAALVSINTL